MTVFNYIFIFLFLSFGSIESKVCLNELMADPTPLAGLPDREYLELFNSGTSAISLKNWILELGSKQKILPDVTIDPLGFLLITSTGGTKDLQQYGKVLEISGFGITNTGQSITLFNADKQQIDRLEYAPDMHRKGCEEGGYALERIDPERRCGQNRNWETSLSGRGGTPGAENSVKAVNSDQETPQVIDFRFMDKHLLEIQFSESLLMPSKWSEVITGLSEGVEIDSIRSELRSGLINIWFRAETIFNGRKYQLVLHGLQDECGNVMEDRRLDFGYYTPVKSDLLINEILFDPYPEGEDFVEIYNNSGHEVAISNLFLATRDASKALKQISPLSTVHRVLPVGSYLAASKSPEGILRYYRAKGEDCLVKMEKFPTLPNLAGTVVLLEGSQMVLDEVAYSEDMHDPLISETEGISLERLRFDRPSSMKSNWHSASKSAGFATPGYRNSLAEATDSTGLERFVTIEPLVFSPNGDGIHDELSIHLHPEGEGWILNITILNSIGRVVKYLANNLSIGTSDELKWNGLGDDFQIVQPGIYLLNFSFFNISGQCRKMRAACVVTDHL